MGLPARWECYAAWNEAIRAELFDGRAGGQPVYVNVDIADLDAAHFGGMGPCAHPSGEPRETLIRSLAGTVDTTDVFKRHRWQAELWRKDFFRRGLTDQTPPFLALLAILVVVAEEMAAEGELAANDYFGRLTRRVNTALGTSYTKDAVQRSYYRHIDGRECQKAGERSLWLLLNDWLDYYGDELGEATAFPVDGREYVSVPVSQALIRSADRARLHRLFARTFEEYRRPTLEEMTSVLSNSLACPPFSRPLVNMWARASNRPRIAELALAELAAWDSTWEEEDGTEGAGRVRARALLRARMVGGPRRAIQLSLAAHASPRIFGTYSVDADAPGLSRRCLAPGHDDVRVQPSSLGSSLAEFAPPDAIDVAELLIRRLELSSGDKHLTRPYRAVNLLALDANEQVYVETDRASAGEPLLVLSSDGLADKTRELLSWVARAGYREADSRSLRGLPEGWVLFADVEVLGQVPDEFEVLPDLEPLLPPRRLEVAMSGGLVLPGGARRAPEWHAARPPEVVVSHPEPSAHIGVSVHQATASGTIETAAGSVEGMGTVSLPLASISVAVPIEVRAEGAGLAVQRSLRLRSAETPRRVEPAALVSLFVDDKGLVAGSGRLQRAAGRAPVGTAASVEGHESGFAAGLPLPPPTPMWTAAAPVLAPDLPGEEDEVDQEGFGSPGHTPEDLPACVLRPGAHHWVLPTSTAETVLGTCIHCGRFERFRNRYHRSLEGGVVRQGVRDLSQVVDRVRSAVRRTPPVGVVGDSAEWDLLLDALSAVGAGSQVGFAALASQTVPHMPVSEAARVMAGLGHIELEQGFDGTQMTWWSAAPPTIVVPEDSPAFLAGFRSTSMVEGLAEIASDLGGETRVLRPGDQPAVVQILVDADRLALVADKVTSERPVQLRHRPSTALVQRLPTLDALVQRLPSASYSTRYEEIFDLSTARWMANTGLVYSGAAVRSLRNPRVYGLIEHAESGGRIVLRKGDLRLIKHMAARCQGQSLISYDATKQEILVPLGAELPWLLDRVAVLCTGARPIRRGGLVAYGRVPGGIASAIWASLGGGDS